MLTFLAFLASLFSSSAVVLAIDRHYYIGIVEIEWDYSTSNEKWVDYRQKKAIETSSGPEIAFQTADMVELDNDTFISNFTARNRRRFHRSKRVAFPSTDHSYVKAVYRLFSDETFWEQLEHPREMGLVGPPIIASPGDRLFIHCKNFARFGFNIHPHLVRYSNSDEGIAISANGGEYLYEWHIESGDGPVGDEPCLLGAYHSALNWSRAEIEAGLFGPVLVCKQNVVPGQMDEYRLRSGELLTFAFAKSFNERESIYRWVNKVQWRNQTTYPSINGMLRSPGSSNPVSLLSRISNCNAIREIPGIYLNLFTLGGVNDSYLLSTSCGLMMTNGRTMSDTVPLHSGSFKILSLQTSELTKFMKDQCFLQSSELLQRVEGMSLSLFPSSSASCLNSSEVSRNLETSERLNTAIPFYNLSVEAVFWNYNSRDACSRYWKLRFVSRSNQTRHQSAGLLGPTIWTSVSQHFRVLLTVPRLLLNEMVNSSSPNLYSLGIRMPEIVEELSRNDESDAGSIVFRYTFAVKPSKIGTKQDSPCRPFIYSATFTQSGAHSSSSILPSFDTGLFGALVVCSSEKALEKAKAANSFVLAPIVIDESLSWLAPLNSDCLSTMSSPIFHTINGHTNGSADFGMLPNGRSVNWYLLAVPPLPGREQLFLHTITFGDQGKRNPIYLEQMDDAKERTFLPGSTVVLHGSGQAVVMEVGRGKSSGVSVERWSIYCQITDCSNDGMVASFSTSTTGGSAESIGATDKVYDQYFIMAQEVDWDYRGANFSLSKAGKDALLSSRRHVFQKLLFRNAFKENRPLGDAHLSLLGPVVLITPEHPVHVTLLNMARRPVSIDPGASVTSSPVKGAQISADGTVEPGKAVTFVWRLSENFRFPPDPSDRFPDCTATLYTSSHDKIGDLYAGLMGPLVICPTRKSSDNTKPTIRRFFTLFARFDETKSSLASDNHLTKSELDSPSHPLVFDTINGRLYGAVDQPGFTIYANQSADWFIFSIGDYNDVHTIHFHGGSEFSYIDVDSRNTPRMSDSITVFPGQSITGLAFAGRMQPVSPGVWPIRCHASEHANRGMVAQYIVSDQDEPEWQRSTSSILFNNKLLPFLTISLILVIKIRLSSLV